MTLLEILQSMVHRLGDDPTSIDSTLKTELTKWVNKRYFAILRRFPNLAEVKETKFMTRAPYTTGTITTTDGSRSVAGSGTAFASSHIGWKFRPGGANDWWIVHAVASGTALTLQEEMNVAYTADTYQIYNEIYNMPYDMIEASHIKIKSIPRELEIKFPQELEDMNMSRIDTGVPYWAIPRGMNEKTYYDTGTVTVTNGSASVTGSGTTFTAAMENRVFRLKRDSKWYRVKTYTNTTTIVLDETYKGASGSALTYDIDPPGNWQFELYPLPNDEYSVYVLYYAFPRLLQDDTDRPTMLPEVFHDVILAGALLDKLEYEEDMDGKLYQWANKSWEEGLAEIQKRLQPENRRQIIYGNKSRAYIETPRDYKNTKLPVE